MGGQSSNLGQSLCHLFHPNPHIYRYVIMTFRHEPEPSPSCTAEFVKMNLRLETTRFLMIRWEVSY